MEYTKNYHLPQWVESDRIQMEDFNAAMESIESGLDGKAAKSDMTQLGATLSENLEQLSGLVGTGGKTCRIAYGTYTGTGAYGTPKVFTFDFKPLALFVGRMTNEQTYTGFFCVVRGMAISTFNFSQCGNLTWTDNSVSIYSSSSAENQWNGALKYCYVAIGVDE